jgi:hypothetical protein
MPAPDVEELVRVASPVVLKVALEFGREATDCPTS